MPDRSHLRARDWQGILFCDISRPSLFEYCFQASSEVLTVLVGHQSMLVSILSHHGIAIDLWLAFLGILGTVRCISSSYTDKKRKSLCADRRVPRTRLSRLITHLTG